MYDKIEGTFTVVKIICKIYLLEPIMWILVVGNIEPQRDKLSCCGGLGLDFLFKSILPCFVRIGLSM